MAESILTEPMMQNADLIALPPRVVTVPAATWTQIVDTNPMRLYFIVVPDANVIDFLLSPIKYGSGAVTGADQPVTPAIVHGSVFPLLVGGVWYLYHTGVSDFSVIEVLRLRDTL